MGWECSTDGTIRNAYSVLVEKPEGKRPCRRLRHTWEDNIRMYLREIKQECVDWMHLAQDRDQWQALVSMVMNFQVPLKMGNFLISSRNLLHAGELVS
jgi:hypothetical protein